MEGKDLGEWWQQTGCKELNKILVNLVGEGIGYIPLSNLTSEFCSLTPSMEEELIPFMTQDGAVIRVTEKKSGSHCVLIWVK